MCCEIQNFSTIMVKYSIIIPVYNRPDELDELLESLDKQTYRDFEVIVVEDGSTVDSRSIAEKYKQRMNINYYYKPNSGPGQSRNYGAERSKGDFLLILDSDCIVPPTYLEAINTELTKNPADAFGGPDRAHESFTDLQKAINYSMTSFFTTGGIRGGKKKIDKFFPRSFNMGIRADVYRKLGGFSPMRFGEDIDFSIRIYEAGYRCRLIPEAWVFHKRRTDFRKFYKQVHNFGIARINLYKKHPTSLKTVHLLPALFTIGTTCCLAGTFFCPYASLPLLAYAILILLDSSLHNHSLRIGIYSIAAAYIQLLGYGSGFLRAWWHRCLLGKGELEAFKKNFYK